MIMEDHMLVFGRDPINGAAGASRILNPYDYSHTGLVRCVTSTGDAIFRDVMDYQCKTF